MSNLAVLDIVLVLLMVGGSLNGLRIGAVRQLVSLLLFYISVVLTTRFYGLLLPQATRILRDAPGGVLEGVLFAVVLLLVYAILSVLVVGVLWSTRPFRRRQYDWRRPPDTTGESVASTFNHLTGVVIGFVTICFWLGVGLLVYHFTLSSSWLEWEDYRRKLQADYNLSVLAPVFYQFLPYILHAIGPWFPEGLPTILLQI